jgi:hypothetical protein
MTPLPCPFCGIIPETDDGESGGAVECCADDCQVNPSVYRDHEPAADGFAACNGLDLAIECWNERASNAKDQGADK